MARAGLLRVGAGDLRILMHLAHFKLEKHMADRMWHGVAKMEQGGYWSMLYKPMLFISVGKRGTGRTSLPTPVFAFGGE